IILPSPVHPGIADYLRQLDRVEDIADSASEVVRGTRYWFPVKVEEVAEGKASGKHKSQAGKKRRGGKRSLEESDPLKFQVYGRIRQEPRPKAKYQDIVTRLKGDRQASDDFRKCLFGGLSTIAHLAQNPLNDVPRSSGQVFWHPPQGWRYLR